MNRPIRVLSVTKSTGGLAQYNLRLCEWIDREQFQFDVVCLSENNQAYAAQIREMGLNAHTIDMQRYAISLGSDIGVIRQLARLAREQEIDVLLGHGSKAGFMVRLAGRMSGTPAVYRLASMSFVPRIHGRKAYIYRALEYMGGFLGGHIVTLSESTREQLTRMRIARPAQVTTIYTGIDLSRFKQSLERDAACAALGLDPARPVIGWAARFVPQKAPLDFINAMAQVKARFPQVQIYMAGDGPLKPDVEAAVERLGLAENISFAPWQTDVPRMLSAFDVYVLSSHWEGLPQSLLEAMAMSRACVSTDVDGNAEVINHGQDGFLVGMSDVDGLARHCMTLLEDPGLRQQMGMAARKRIEDRFAVQGMIAEWQTLLRQQAKQT